MKYLAIFVVMLVLAYVLSRPAFGPGAAQQTDRDRAIAAHEITVGMSVADVLKSAGDSDVKTSTIDGRIVWGYKKDRKYVLFTAENGVIGVGTVGPDGGPYFSGKDAQIFNR
jgi:hypothetical protein